MNIYEKISQARIDLQNLNLKKSGKNKHAGYSYYELPDFLPSVNEIFHKLKLTAIFRCNNEMAVLRVVDSEKEGSHEDFTCPMSSSQLKGCQEAQNLGATITYLRRYLYVNALEITEQDALDSVMNPNDQPNQQTQQEVCGKHNEKKKWSTKKNKFYCQSCVNDWMASQDRKAMG